MTPRKNEQFTMEPRRMLVPATVIGAILAFALPLLWYTARMTDMLQSHDEILKRLTVISADSEKHQILLDVQIQQAAKDRDGLLKQVEAENAIAATQRNKIMSDQAELAREQMAVLRELNARIPSRP